MNLELLLFYYSFCHMCKKGKTCIKLKKGKRKKKENIEKEEKKKM